MGTVPVKVMDATAALVDSGLHPAFARDLVRYLSDKPEGSRLLNKHDELIPFAQAYNKRIVDDLHGRKKNEIGRAVHTEDTNQAKNPPLPGIWGAGMQGIMDSFAGRAGYTVPGVADTLGEAQNRSHYRLQYSRDPWTAIPEHYKKEHGYDEFGKKAMYRAGMAIGSIAGNALRSRLFNAYPADWWTSNAQRFIVNAENGFPVAKTEWVPVPDATLTGYKVKPITQPGVRESGAIGALGAFGSYEAMNLMSGNYNPLNISEGMRPDGYSALSPDEDDPRKSTNPALDVVQRYFLSRKGRILPWEQFHNERPEVSYADYTRYKDWQGGKDPNDILNKATLGIMKGTMSGLTGQPEFQMMGVNMTPTGVGAGILTTLGARKLNSVLGSKAKEEFDQFMGRHPNPKNHELLAKSPKQEEQQDYSRILRNPFYRHEFRREAKAPHFHVGEVQGLPTIPQPTGAVP